METIIAEADNACASSRCVPLTSPEGHREELDNGPIIELGGRRRGEARVQVKDNKDDSAEKDATPRFEQSRGELASRAAEVRRLFIRSFSFFKKLYIKKMSEMF